METIEIIRGMLASMPQCRGCGAPATREGYRRGIRSNVCDACDAADPIEYSDADAIRAAVRMVAEAEKPTSGERVVWSDAGDEIEPAGRIIVKSGRIQYQQQARSGGEWVAAGLYEMPAAARVFLGRATLAYVGAADATADTEPAPAGEEAAK